MPIQDAEPHLPTGAGHAANWAQKSQGRLWGARGQLRSSPGFSVSYTQNGQFVRVKPSATGSPSVGKNLNFLQAYGDYILTTQGIAVARPAYCRCESVGTEIIYGGAYTYSFPHDPPGGGPSSDPLAYLYRVSAGPSANENQGVIPYYTAELSIFCYQPQGGTGVMSDPLDTVTSPNGVPVPIIWQHDGAFAWTAFADQTFGT